MKTIRIGIFAIIVHMLALAGAMAQEQAAQADTATGEPPELIIDFTVLAWDRNDDALFFESLGQENEVYLPTQYRSEEFRYVGNNPLTFYRPEKGPEGEDIRVPMATVTLDPSVKRVLLLFLKNPDGADLPLRVIPLDDGLNGFPVRSYRFFNLSNELVGLKLNEHKAILEKHQDAIIELDDGEALIQMGIYANRGGELKDVLNARWPHRGNTRYLVFIIESPYTRGSLHTRSIPEYF